MSRCNFRPLALAVASLALGACGMLQPEPQSGVSLAALPEARMPATDNPIAMEDLDQIEERYEKALAVAEAASLRRHIQLRLADLAMTRAEREQAEATEVRRFFDRPIELYSQLLAEPVAVEEGAKALGPTPDQLYYKLAKAYALDGRMEEADQVLSELAQRHPDSPYFAETQFRRAQAAFSRGDYAAAEHHYRQALQSDTEAFNQNSLYMRAWAQFKRADYPAALESFTQLLDQLLAGADQPEHVEQALTEQPSGQRQILQDSLRAMALALTYLEGAPSILTLQENLGARPYEYLLYRQLGDIYREQERYRDAADTYAQFVAQNPNSGLAPRFSVLEIETYLEGDFPSLVPPAKEAYVRRYGLHSNYWQHRGGNLQPEAREYLHQYLVELASFAHARAQRLDAEQQNADTAVSAAALQQAYREAAAWYRDFVASFPQDPEVVEIRFLLAEALNRAGELAPALDAYEQVAYLDRDPKRGAEAGYAAVLLSRQLAEKPPGSGETLAIDLEFWRERAVDNALRFAQGYPGDARATAVLAFIARQLMDLNQPERAAQVAEHLLAFEPSAQGSERFSAWLVLGHSRFDLEQYQIAEQAYWQVLELWPEHGLAQNAPSQAEVRERIAASVYQRAQQALAANQAGVAVELLLSIAELAPETQVAISAQYDAGHQLMQLGRWAQAEQVLLAFRRRYPDHSLTQTLPARLAKIYQEQQNWAQAADELVGLEALSENPALKRSSLYLAAELYERAGLTEQAIEHYRRYAHSHPEPLAENMEAQFRLSELYAGTSEPAKRNFWLESLVASHAQAGAAQSGRSTYLAAFSAIELAEQSFNNFVSLPLNLPLQQSLPRKRAALEQALNEQKQVLSYGVAEFATRASHRMGAIYHRLSRDLMDSERPEGLSLLELEQYDILLEEQAYPFEEKAIEVYETNVRRSWDGIYDHWVEQSFDSLAEILPARFGKQEQTPEVSDGIH